MQTTRESFKDPFRLRSPDLFGDRLDFSEIAEATLLATLSSLLRRRQEDLLLYFLKPIQKGEVFPLN